MSRNKKHVNELSFKENIYYYPEHTWAEIRGDQVRVGITDYAQDQLGELIFIQLPTAGDEFKQGDIFGQVESAKSVSSLYMPVSGKVVSVNNEVEDDPEIINHDPYETGWLIQVQPYELKELKSILSKENYINLLHEKDE